MINDLSSFFSCSSKTKTENNVIKTSLENNHKILTGLTDRAEAAKLLYSWGAKEVLITHNPEELAYDGERIYTCPLKALNLSGRSGRGDTTFDVINKYFAINNMPIVSSNYWNGVHGNTAEEVLQDEEGLQTMRILGNNMAWILKCLQLGKENGIEPVKERKIMTNFIR